MTESLNILEEVPWMLTTQGYMTPKDIFLSDDETLRLDSTVPGYVYGAQFRFLMTILPLLYKVEKIENDETFSKETVDEVFEILAPFADLFSETDPFLQVTQADLSEEEGEIIPPSNSPLKLLPEGQSTDDNQSKFWNLDAKERNFFNIQEAVLALVSYYFYGVGTNTKLSKNGNKLTNGSSGLRYKNSVEIIPFGENGIIESLLMSTPKNFLESESGALLPHWADRRGLVMSGLDPLWAFSWSANTVFCEFSEDRKFLVSISRGGSPNSWRKNTPLAVGEKYPKTYNDNRSEEDPLFFYKEVPTKDGSEFKMWRGPMSTSVYETVAKWHSEDLSKRLENKFRRNLVEVVENLEDFIFLEHGTEGASGSFNIRHSVIIKGWSNELLPLDVQINISDAANKVLSMQRELSGMFTENGTCKHLIQRKEDVLTYYWNDCDTIIEDIVSSGYDAKDLEKRLKKIAVETFEKVSSDRDLIHIRAHMKGLTKLLTYNFGRK